MHNFEFENFCVIPENENYTYRLKYIHMHQISGPWFKKVDQEAKKWKKQTKNYQFYKEGRSKLNQNGVWSMVDCYGKCVINHITVH